MDPTTLLILSLAPVFILMTWIYYRDKYEKEPIKLILLGLVAGGIVIFPVIAIEYLLSSLGEPFFPIVKAFFEGFVVAGFTEELFKFAMVYLLFWRNRNFNERFDGIVYAVSVSLGFAAIENIFYVFDGGIKIGVLRAITAVPAHTLFGITMGFYLGLAKFAPFRKNEFLLKALLIPWLLHGIYDFLILSQLPLLLLAFFPTIILMWKIGLKEIRTHQMTSFFRPQPPPPPDIIVTPETPATDSGRKNNSPPA
jgi:protease PrsW